MVSIGSDFLDLLLCIQRDLTIFCVVYGFLSVRPRVTGTPRIAVFPRLHLGGPQQYSTAAVIQAQLVFVAYFQFCSKWCSGVRTLVCRICMHDGRRFSSRPEYIESLIDSVFQSRFQIFVGDAYVPQSSPFYGTQFKVTARQSRWTATAPNANTTIDSSYMSRIL